MEKLGSTKKRGELFLGISVFEIIGIIIMFGFGYLPTPELLTHTGMRLIGVLLGTVFLYSTVGLTWPSALAWFALAPLAKELVGGARGIYTVITLTMGDWLTIFVMLSIVLTFALTSSGVMKRLATWFMTRKIAQKSPWSFTIVYFVMSLIIGLIVNPAIGTIFLYSFTSEVCERIGYAKGEKFPRMLVIGVTFCTLLGYASTPLGIGAGMIGMGVFANVSGGATVPLMNYAAVALPVAIVCWAGMILGFYLFLKPDMSKFSGIDYNSIVGEKQGKMSLSEKLTVLIYVLVCVGWMTPSFLDIFAKGKWLTNTLAEGTVLAPCLLGLVAMLLIKVKGKPLLDFKAATKAVPWEVIFMLATARALSELLIKEGTGFSAFIQQFVVSRVGTMGTFALIAMFVVVLGIATNLTNNTPLTTLFVAALVPQAAIIGIAPTALAVLITISCQCAFTLPSGYVTIAMLHGNEWNTPSTSMKHGLFQLILSIVFTLTLGYFLASVVF